MNIKIEINKLPEDSGIYMMKNTFGEIIYIGKAKNLKKRVKSYFTNLKSHNKKTKELVNNISDFEYIITDTEIEALVLECNLIKKHYPKYNIALKDNKGYPYIKITKEKYPKVFITRDYKKDKNEYFGPYVNIYAIQEVMELIYSLWKPRQCNKILPRDIGKVRECLNYHISKCSGCCNNKINYEDYNINIKNIIKFLNGDNKETIKELESKMKNFSTELKYEEAIEIRNKINSINKISEKQKLEKDTDDNTDIIGISKNNNKAMVQIFYIRKGKMLGRDKFTFDNVLDLEESEIMTDFIKQYYGDLTYVPEEIILGNEIKDSLLIKWLEIVKGAKVTVTVPKRGEKLRLLEMANKNAEIFLEQFGDSLNREKKRTVGAVEEIKNILKISNEIKRIEAYDISNIQGFESVGSMVVFVDGKPKKEEYRKFKIKTVVGADDYKSIEEVIFRRFSRYKKEMEEKDSNGKFSNLPDLILVDGGKGQISSAKKSLKALELNIEIAGMVKDDNHRTEGLLYNKNQTNLKKSSEGFKLLTRIQDEVHRFAIQYHRKLRSKTVTTSKLDEIKGVGKKRRNLLLKHFKSLERIKEASISELLEVNTINKKIADEIYYYFNDNLLK